MERCSGGCFVGLALNEYERAGEAVEFEPKAAQLSGKRSVWKVRGRLCDRGNGSHIVTHKTALTDDCMRSEQ